MLASDLDVSDMDPTTVDEIGKAGGMLPPGKYHVKLDGANDKQSSYGNGGVELEFVTLTGPFAGCKVKDTIWGWSDGDDADKVTKAKNRYIVAGRAVGLLTLSPKTKRYEPAPGKNSFGDCLGNDCVIEVTHRTYKRKDDGSEAKAVNITFAGYFPTSDPKVKDVPKAKPAPAGTPAPANTAPARPPQTQIDDL